jgi:MFS family permease
LISSGYACSTIVTGSLSPFFGIFIDRYGSRRVALPGIIVISLVVASFSFVNGSTAQWMFLWALYGLIGLSVKTTVWTAAVAGVFKTSQGLAIGITLCGAAFAPIILLPLTNVFIAKLGWRLTYVIIGLGWGGATLLICWLFLFDAHSRRTTAAVRSAAQQQPLGRPAFPGLSITQAWKSSALWRIAISTLIVMSLTMGLQIHQIEILGEAGVARSDAALLASMAAVAAVVGKLTTGFLLDRYAPNWSGGLTLTATAVAFGLLVNGVRSPALIVIAMLVNGYTLGTNLQICSYLTVLYAGMRYYGVIFGFMSSLIAIGSGLGPLLAGYTYDVWGGYGLFLVIGAIGSVVSGVLIFTLPAYPKFAARAQAEVKTA